MSKSKATHRIFESVLDALADQAVGYSREVLKAKTFEIVLLGIQGVRILLILQILITLSSLMAALSWLGTVVFGVALFFVDNASAIHPYLFSFGISALIFTVLFALFFSERFWVKCLRIEEQIDSFFGNDVDSTQDSCGTALSARDVERIVERVLERQNETNKDL